MFKSRTKTTAFVLAGAAFVTMTSSCSGSGDVFGKAQGAADELPVGGTPEVVDSVIADSTRFLWETEDLAFYAAKSGESRDAQSLILVRSLDLASYCSTQMPVVVTADASGEYAFGPNAPTASGWDRLSESFWRLSE